MKYLFTLIIAFIFINFSKAQTSYVFNPMLQNIDTVACLADTNALVLRPEGWKIYQTTNDEWNGPVDSSICVEGEIYFGNFRIKLESIDTSRHLFVCADSSFNHTLLPKNAVYNFALSAYMYGNGDINVFGNCGTQACSYIAINILKPDSAGTGWVHRYEPAGLDTINGMMCWEYVVCTASEKFDSQFVDNVIAAFKFQDTDSTSNLMMYDFDLTEESCSWALLPEVTDTFTSITANASGGDYVYYMWGNIAYLGLYNDSTYPSPNHLSYLNVYPGDNQQTVQQDIYINVDWGSSLILQPFAQLRGAPVNGQDSLYHNLTIELYGGTICLAEYIEMILNPGDEFAYRAGHIDFHGAMSCILLSNEATLHVKDSATLNYGSGNHQGMFGVRENSIIEIGSNATLNIYNTMAIREQNPLNGPKQFYMTLNEGSTLRFMQGSHLTNMFCSDGTMKLNVYMKGGILDDSGLSEEEKLLINRIYDTTIPGHFEIWPNPATENLHLTIDNSRYKQITFSDISGRVLHQADVSAAVADIDVSNFVNGIYFIRASSDKDAVTQTWVKQ